VNGIARLHIAFPIPEGPAAGGYQFLRTLRTALRGGFGYAEAPDEADAILFNSYQAIPAALAIRRRRPDLAFIHRVDGPIRLYNRMDDPRDDLTSHANALLADATVFQSGYSRASNAGLGFEPDNPTTIVTNTADPEIFLPREPGPPAARLRIVATCMSTNPNKGFEEYAWLDRNLDFARFEMTFVGNSPIRFANITMLPPQDSAGLAAILRGSDVFVTASRKDPCSNSLCEALGVGLPAIALRDGGHPELVGAGGLLFDQIDEVPGLLERVRASHADLARAIVRPSAREVARAYCEFAASICAVPRRAKRPSLLAMWRARRIFGSH
jgi:glycosyltransferase involved in cell wall biosynthesis